MDQVTVWDGCAIVAAPVRPRLAQVTDANPPASFAVPVTTILDREVKTEVDPGELIVNAGEVPSWGIGCTGGSGFAGGSGLTGGSGSSGC